MDEQKKKLVIFDFDGVLADTIQFCFNMYKEKNPNLTFKNFQDLSIGNWINSIENALLGKTLIKGEDFKDKYKEEVDRIKIENILVETIIELNKNYILAIVSSTDSIYIRNFLEKENINKYFSDIFGSDINKDKVIKIKILLNKYGISHDDTVFVTDSLGDIKDGNKCGVKSIGVTWGVHSKETLEKGNPAIILDNPNELLGVIKNMLK